MHRNRLKHRSVNHTRSRSNFLTPERVRVEPGISYVYIVPAPLVGNPNYAIKETFLKVYF